MRVEIIYGRALADYRFAGDHPLKPERFTLAVLLAREWGIVADGDSTTAAHAETVEPEPAVDADLLRVHAPEYVAAVKSAGDAPGRWLGGFGIGHGDTPPFPDMHRAAALTCGATSLALSRVLAGSCNRAFSPAGGLHHAHRDRAAGFCVYNDLAVAMARALADHPGLRIAYVDVDAHHGDGVQEAFYDRSDVLTISVHESGRYLYPGTGRAEDTGTGDGCGFAMNVPLPPGANDECYEAVLQRAIVPAVRAYAPDVVLVQLGADTHRNDPLAHLDTTVAGQYATARRLVGLAEQVCAGRIVATGGGGYDAFSAVPRAWACVPAALLCIDPPELLPASWRAAAAAAAPRGAVVPYTTFEERGEPAAVGLDVIAETTRLLDRIEAEHPMLRDC